MEVALVKSLWYDLSKLIQAWDYGDTEISGEAPCCKCFIKLKKRRIFWAYWRTNFKNMHACKWNLYIIKTLIKHQFLLLTVWMSSIDTNISSSFNALFNLKIMELYSKNYFYKLWSSLPTRPFQYINYTFCFNSVLYNNWNLNSYIRVYGISIYMVSQCTLNI